MTAAEITNTLQSLDFMECSPTELLTLADYLESIAESLRIEADPEASLLLAMLASEVAKGAPIR